MELRKSGHQMRPRSGRKSHALPDGVAKSGTDPAHDEISTQVFSRRILCGYFHLSCYPYNMTKL